MRIVEREAWGASPPSGGYQSCTWRTGTPLNVHHSAGSHPAADATPAEEAAVVRAIQSYHQRVNGWTDVGYHFLIPESGRVYRGRPAGTRGAHSPSVNHQPGACLLGDYSAIAPTRAQLVALDELRRLYRLGPLVPHRDTYPTACPGDAAVAVLRGEAIARPIRPRLPHGETLELTVAGHPGSPFRGDADGWGSALGPLQWIARRGLDDGPHRIEWRGGTWHGARAVANVARSLVSRFLTDAR